MFRVKIGCLLRVLRIDTSLETLHKPFVTRLWERFQKKGGNGASDEINGMKKQLSCQVLSLFCVINVFISNISHPLHQ